MDNNFNISLWFMSVIIFNLVNNYICLIYIMQFVSSNMTNIIILWCTVYTKLCQYKIVTIINYWLKIRTGRQIVKEQNISGWNECHRPISHPLGLYWQDSTLSWNFQQTFVIRNNSIIIFAFSQKMVKYYLENLTVFIIIKSAVENVSIQECYSFIIVY